MRQKVTKIIRNVLLERAITGISARSPCAICPLNNIRRNIMRIKGVIPWGWYQLVNFVPTDAKI